jgi:glyoxylase-like metal-dependent hydrolase (beta-lactamase superfamily II)
MIHILDTHQLGLAGIIAATAVETDDGVVLFDTGPESTFNNIVAELSRAGLRPHDVDHVFLSHIHFDHAGAAWRFAQLGATIYVHPRGSPHLIDPTKLIESAKRIFGTEMERLWGQIAPVPANRVKVLQDGDVVRLAPLQIHAVATPGHASHHHVYWWDDKVFGGDVAGVRIGNGPPIPPFVSPELNIEQWRDSIGKIRALNAAELYLPHFGRINGPIEEHLAALDERVARWSEWFRRRISNPEDETNLRSDFAEYEHQELRRGGASEAEVDGYEAADPSYMAVSAAIRYWQKFHPEAIKPEQATGRS